MVDFNDLLVQTREKLRNETKLRAFSPGSIARGILDIYNVVASDIDFNLDLRVTSALISSATGDDLDILGKMIGLDRIDSAYALGQVKISIDSVADKTLQDLKDIIEERTGTAPTNITIAAGTEITSEDGTIVFNTVSDINLGEDPVYVDALAANVGENGNISSGTLSRINSTDENLSYIVEFILVTNTTPIDNGSDIESDENYRFRIVNLFTSSAKANDTSLRLAALSVPGVADAIIRNYEYGIGSTGLFIISESPIVSQGILNAVQQAVNNTKSSGEHVMVSAPEYRAFKMEVVLQFTPTTPAGDKDIILEQVKENIIDYVNNLEMGDEIVINEIRQIIQQTSDNIYDHEFVKLGLGDYNFETGLIDYFEPSLAVNQQCDETQKFVTNSKLITACY